MDNALLGHLLQLAARTGDRLIVVDPTSQRPFVLMGIAQYEGLIARGVPSPSSRGGVGGGADERGSEPAIGMGPAIAPGLDAVAQRANAELATWRASQPVVIAEQPATVGGFSPESLQPVPPDEDRFYVEPLE